MSCIEIYDCSDPKPVRLNCKKPDYLKRGDKVALISPSFFTPMENVEKTAALWARRMTASMPEPSRNG